MVPSGFDKLLFVQPILEFFRSFGKEIGSQKKKRVVGNTVK
jgi:hypothetical protein